MEVKLARKPSGSISVAESVERFRVTGRGLHNRHGLSMITGFVGHCCDQWVVHLHMAAQVSVIAAVRIGPAPTVLSIALGDLIRVDYTVCQLINRRYADPILVAVDHLKTLERKGVTL